MITIIFLRLENEWKYYDGNKRELRDVKEDLDKEYERMGIKRPESFYGFWTPSTLADEIKTNFKR